MQNNLITSYILKLTFYSLAISFIGMFSLIFLPKEYISQNLPYFIAMFYACTGISYISIYLLVKNKKMRFENIFMITKFSKLFIYIITFCVVLFLGNENPISFLISFALLFALYLLFDTLTLKKLTKTF